DLFSADLEKGLLTAKNGLRALLGEETDIDDAEMEAVAIGDRPVEDYRASAPIEDSQSAYDSHANYFGFGLFLALRQPLDIAERLARMEHARADAGLLAAQERLAHAGIGFEIDQAFAGLAEARRRLQLAEAAQKKARGWFS